LLESERRMSASDSFQHDADDGAAAMPAASVAVNSSP
jgi:hypothetical protein